MLADDEVVSLFGQLGSLVSIHQSKAPSSSSLVPCLLASSQHPNLQKSEI